MTAPVAAGRLKSFAERIGRLLDEKKGIGEDIADIYQEAKSAGYVPKILRKVITRARADQSKLAEEDSLQSLYEAELDGPTREAVKLAAQGATARQIEAATGIDQATVARSVSLKKKRETKESCGGVESRHAGTEVADSASTAEGSLTGRNLQSESPSEVRGADKQPSAGVAPGPQDIDTLEIPSFLRRSPQQEKGV